ncbi:unnamed protein product [Clavelina lepadiformis]|uniref:Uncharacterized protein n=1 Tax=Clavelina lepadiformis TaxID=159417 RepID=A0ABP0GDS2_CLALP
MSRSDKSLLVFRGTPLQCGPSSIQLLMGRRIRNWMPLQRDLLHGSNKIRQHLREQQKQDTIVSICDRLKKQWTDTSGIVDFVGPGLGLGPRDFWINGLTFQFVSNSFTVASQPLSAQSVVIVMSCRTIG